MVICLELGADLHMAQLMPLPLTVSCSSKIQIGFTFLVPAYPGCPGKEAVKWLLLLLMFNKSVFSFLRMLTMWHYPHSLVACLAAVHCAAIDRYLLPVGPTAANLQLWDRQMYVCLSDA